MRRMASAASPRDNRLPVRVIKMGFALIREKKHQAVFSTGVHVDKAPQLLNT